MRVSVLFSGGKDSAYAAYLVQQQGWEVASLLAVIPGSDDSYMFHVPNVRWTSLQAEAMGLPVRTAGSEGEKEKELEDVEALMREEDVDGFVSGAIASDYQWSRLNGICHALGKPLHSPLWRKDQAMVVREMVRAGLEFMVVGVYAHGFDEGWLGKTVTPETVDELESLRDRFGISVSGEGGEMETFVLDSPGFSKRIVVDEAETSWRRDSGTYVIRKASLAEKG